MYNRDRKQFIRCIQAGNKQEYYFLKLSNKYDYLVSNCKDREKIDKIKDKLTNSILKMYSY